MLLNLQLQTKTCDCFVFLPQILQHTSTTRGRQLNFRFFFHEFFLVISTSLFCIFFDHIQTLYFSMIYDHGPFNKVRMVCINFSLTTIKFSYTRSASSRHIRLICSASTLIVVVVSVLIISKHYISQ